MCRRLRRQGARGSWMEGGQVLKNRAGRLMWQPAPVGVGRRDGKIDPRSLWKTTFFVFP